MKIIVKVVKFKDKEKNLVETEKETFLIEEDKNHSGLLSIYIIQEIMEHL